MADQGLSFYRKILSTGWFTIEYAKLFMLDQVGSPTTSVTFFSGWIVVMSRRVAGLTSHARFQSVKQGVYTNINPIKTKYNLHC